MKLTERIKHAWNAFNDKRMDESPTWDIGYGNSSPKYRSVTSFRTSSFASSIFNRIAIDVATTHFQHVQIDEKTDDRTTIDSGLNYCITTEANIDQTSTAFIQDLVYSMFDEGVVAVVPVDKIINPKSPDGYDIETMRVGKIVQWYPRHIRVSLYNEEIGDYQEIYVEKREVAIIENPLYSITNGENSTLKRLIRKMNNQDMLDDDSSQRRLDLIISLPHAVKTEVQLKSAEKRMKLLESQLKNNGHGIAYIDGTEGVTQLNRPIESQVSENVDKLKKEFYNQLGLTENIFNGTASEGELRAYYSRTIDPIIEFILQEFRRKFITKTDRINGHTIEAYRDMFKFISATAVADMGDKMRRNSILTANEVRKIMQIKPHSDPQADVLYNPNMPEDKQPVIDRNNQGSLTPPENNQNE